MGPAIRKQFDARKGAFVTWDPVKGGKRAWICYEDKITEDLGPDPTGARFAIIAERMMKGHNYPPDAVQYYCEAHDTQRNLLPGDPVLQRAPIFPFIPWLGMWSMVRICVAERTDDWCILSYVTTTKHHGRGIWRAELRRIAGRLSIQVTSTTSPNSWLFWLGLPLARFLQLRARRRAIEEFRKLA
jgi:hypothetical protein